MSMTLGERRAVRSRHPALAEHLRIWALNTDGPFRLASGRRSNYYLDAKVSGLEPEGISLAVEALASETRDLEFQAIGGLELGAAAIIGAFVYQSQASSRPVKGFIVRKREKIHGTMKKIEGPLPDKPCKIVIVDDVVTSGQSMMQAVDAVREQGHEVVLAISVVDREEGAAECFRQQGIEYRSLVRVSELGVGNDVNPGSGP